MERKENISVGELYNQLPQEFVSYMDYVRVLEFEDKPDYSYLRKIFQNLFVRRGFEYDCVFDWTVKRYWEHMGEYKRNEVAVDPGGK